MTYLQAAEDGFLKAEQTQLEFFNAAMAQYEQALTEITDELKDVYASLAGISPDDYYNAMLKYNRLGKLKKSITEKYQYYAKQAGKEIKTGLVTGAYENYNRQLYLSSWLVDITPSSVDKTLIEYMCTGSVELWKQLQKETIKKIYGDLSKYAPQAGTLVDLLSKNYAAELNSILSAIDSGLIQGKSYAKISKSLKEIIGEALATFDGYDGTGAAYKAMRIARTEGNRTLNAANLAQQEYLKSGGIDIKKRWLASLDGRTRSKHQQLDGKQADPDKPFPDGPMAPGQFGIAAQDINCRCTTITIINGQEPSLRSAKNPETGEREIISWKPYDEWEKSLK